MSTDATSALPFDEDSMVIDLANVQAQGPSLLDPGTYDCSVESVEYKKSQRSGNPMLEWRFRTDPLDGASNGRVLFWHTVLNHANGVANLKQAVQAIAPELDMSAFNVQNASADLAGRACRVRIRISKREDGTERNDVVNVQPPAASDTGFLPS